MDRRVYIGSSNAATILGQNPFQSRIDLFKHKSENGTHDEIVINGHIRRGVTLENIVIEWIRDNMDCSINSVDNWLRHDVNAKELMERYGEGHARAYVEQRIAAGEQIMLMDTTHLSPVNGVPYIGGHPDGIGDGVLYEIKVPTSERVKRLANEGLSDSYYYQVQHMLWITGLPLAKVLVWDTDKWWPYVFEVEPDRITFGQFEQAYPAFWRGVEEGRPPEEIDEATDHRGTQESMLLTSAREYEVARSLEGFAKMLKTQAKIGLETALGGRGLAQSGDITVRATKKAGRYGTYTIFNIDGVQLAEPDASALADTLRIPDRTPREKEVAERLATVHGIDVDEAAGRYLDLIE